VRGRSSLAHLLLAARPLLRGSLRTRAVRLAASLAPDSVDATRALRSLLEEGGSLRGAEDLTTAGVVAEALLVELQGRHDLGTSEAGRLLEFYAARIRSQGLRSSSQLLQDVWVLFATGAKRGGYFVEFGALDGVALSNTLLLERSFGWTGLLAEPNPKYHAALAAQRSARIDKRCVWQESGRTVQLIDCGELSTIQAYRDLDGHAGTRRRAAAACDVETVRLDDLLAQHGAPRTFDFLSVDTEGSEFDILQTLDFERYRPMTICVEHNFTEAERRIDRLLADRGYRRCLPRVSRWDGWYVHASHEARVPGEGPRAEGP
jgi:FkbM family methyltransferase